MVAGSVDKIPGLKSKRDASQSCAQNVPFLTLHVGTNSRSSGLGLWLDHTNAGGLHLEMRGVSLPLAVWTFACSCSVGGFSLNGGVRQFFATTVSGMEPILAKELQALPDVSSIKTGKSGVEFQGSIRTGLEGLLWLRTPLKLMEKVSVANRVTSKNSLHEWIHACAPWDEMITPQNTLKCDAILGRENSVELSHSHFTALTVKNAIVDQIRDKLDNRPSVDLLDPDLPLLLYLHRGKGTLYRVWSGEHSMHKRGYRPDVTHKAALRETTAAAM
jgi:hypothetical protein